jgi:hypothetical protein
MKLLDYIFLVFLVEFAVAVITHNHETMVTSLVGTFSCLIYKVFQTLSEEIKKSK